MGNAEFDWEDLVYAISESSLIPIVGDEMRLLEQDGQQRTIEHWCLQHLPEKLDLEAESSVVTLNELATRILDNVPLAKKERRKRMIANKLEEVFESNPPPIPDTLIQLAEITHFNVFLTTAVDTLLEQAIEQVRGVPCLTMANSLVSGIDDLADVEPPQQPCVYHLFGSMPRDEYIGTDFAITEEDKLEYLQALGDTARKPKNLFEYLDRNELMFMGCSLPDVVARLMLRTLADCRLFPEKAFRFICSQEHIGASLQLFLEGLNGELLLAEKPSEFTNKMRSRWQAVADELPEQAEQPKQLMPKRSRKSVSNSDQFIFVSYRWEDKEAVQRLVSSLESKVAVWWDNDMEPGSWEKQMTSKILGCVLFIPVLSRNGQAGGTTAKQEWNLALEKRQKFSDDETFIIPLIIDDLEANAERIPSKLWDEQVYSCQDGKLDDKVLNLIVDAYREQVRYMHGS